jgi:hypothetical protein
MSILKVLLAVFVLNLVVFTNVNGQAYHPLLGNKYKWEQFQGGAATLCGLTQGQLIYEGNDTNYFGINYKVMMGDTVSATYNQLPFAWCPPYYVTGGQYIIHSFVREDTISRKVYIYDFFNNTEKTLYDFSLTDGDTLFNPFDSFNNYFVVDSVRFQMISGLGYRKFFYLHEATLTCGLYYIEGIGSILGVDLPFDWCNGSALLYCIKDSMNNSIYGNCLTNVFLHEIDPLNRIEFHYLNSEKIFFIAGDYSNISVDIFDVTGKLEFSNSKLKANERQSLLAMDPGIYLYSIHCNEKTKSGKFIVY